MVQGLSRPPWRECILPVEASGQAAARAVMLCLCLLAPLASPYLGTQQPLRSGLLSLSSLISYPLPHTMGVIVPKSLVTPDCDAFAQACFWPEIPFLPAFAYLTEKKKKTPSGLSMGTTSRKPSLHPRVTSHMPPEALCLSAVCVLSGLCALT